MQNKALILHILKNKYIRWARFYSETSWLTSLPLHLFWVLKNIHPRHSSARNSRPVAYPNSHLSEGWINYPYFARSRPTYRDSRRSSAANKKSAMCQGTKRRSSKKKFTQLLTVKWHAWSLANHRIIESPRLEKTSKIIQSNHPPTTNIP